MAQTGRAIVVALKRAPVRPAKTQLSVAESDAGCMGERLVLVRLLVRSTGVTSMDGFLRSGLLAHGLNDCSCENWCS